MSVSKIKQKKVKKKRINWKELMFHLHRKDISAGYDFFRKRHLDWSINRCAYMVLKTYYSTTAMRDWKKMFEEMPDIFYYDYDRILYVGDWLKSVNAYE